MPVNSTHPRYDEALPFWLRMRDARAGEDAVKDAGATYLPVPPGIASTKGEHSPEYVNYKSRARFPEAVAPAAEGMVGLMGSDTGEVEMPSALEYLRQTATPDGLDLNGLLRRVRHEAAVVGRYVLFVDVPAEGGDPFIATYSAESLINWRSSGGRFTLAVFEEMVEETGEDGFELLQVKQWREASLDSDGTYTVRLWRMPQDGDKDDEPEVIDETVPTRRGQPLDFVPVVVVGSRDLLPDPDDLPLLAVANKSLHFYRQYADYAMQLFMSANGTTPYFLGAHEPPETVGPTELWTGPAEGSVGYIEIQGTGLEAQKASLDAIGQEIADAAMRALGSGNRSAESGEALRLRFHSQTASLGSIAKTTAAGLRQALRYVAEWVGASPDEVNVEANTDFIAIEPDASVLQGILGGVERGLMPDMVLWDYLRRTKLTELTTDQLRAESPAVQMLNPGDEG